jgi:heat shock protein HslJ
MTQSICATDELQAQETAFLGGLNIALFYERDGDSLTLLDGEQTKLIDLTETNAPE